MTKTVFFNRIGRLLEITNGCIVEAKHGNPSTERRAAFGKLDGQVWVGSGCSDDEKAAVQGYQKPKGGSPPRCRPTPADRPMAGLADDLPVSGRLERLLASGTRR